MREDFDKEKLVLIHKELKQHEIEAAAALDEQKRYYESKVIQLSENWEAKSNERLKELENRLNEEFERRLQERETEIRDEKERELNECRELFAKQIDEVESENKKKIDSYSLLNEKLEKAIMENDALEKKVDEARNEFQTCIERFSRLQKQEADFLFPSHIKKVK